MHKSAKRGWVSNRRCVLTSGSRVSPLSVLVDADVLQHLDQYAWYASDRGVVRYQGGHRPHTVYLAAVVSGGLCIHRDGDKSNCQRENLIPATFSQIQQGRHKRRNSRSRFKGLSLVKGKWVARIGTGHIGYFASETDAARAYDSAVIALRGPYARNLNFPAIRRLAAQIDAPGSLRTHPPT